jgi:hypothetical protein
MMNIYLVVFTCFCRFNKRSERNSISTLVRTSPLHVATTDSNSAIRSPMRFAMRFSLSLIIVCGSMPNGRGTVVIRLAARCWCSWRMFIKLYGRRSLFAPTPGTENGSGSSDCDSRDASTNKIHVFHFTLYLSWPSWQHRLATAFDVSIVDTL